MIVNINLDLVFFPCFFKQQIFIIDILKLTNQKYNQTLLLVTHDEKIALQADRIITIGDGKIIKDEVIKK